MTNEFTGDDRISPAQLEWEVGEVHRLDPDHQVVVTSYTALNVTVDWLQLWTPSLLDPFGPTGIPRLP